MPMLSSTFKSHRQQLLTPITKLLFYQRPINLYRQITEFIQCFAFVFSSSIGFAYLVGFAEQNNIIGRIVKNCYIYQKQIIDVYIICLQKVQMFDFPSLAQQKKPYYYMHHSLKKAKTVKDRAIFFFGKIRSGKSTSFNWFINPSTLIGEKVGILPNYALNLKQDSTAQISDEYKSVTLIPNMANITENGTEVNLIDLPGFDDSRSAQKILLVSYIINTFFEYSKSVKFIIVVNCQSFLNVDGESFIKSIKEFVKLFKNLKPLERSNVYQSASLLITSVPITHYAEDKQSYLKTLQKNLQKILTMAQSNSDLKQNVSFMKQFLLSVINGKRLQLFKLAEDKKSPQKSNVIQELNRCGWKYFNLKQNCQNIAYPYQQYYGKLKSQEQDNIDQLIFKKIREFESLQQKMANIINTYLENPYNRRPDLIFGFKTIEKILMANICHEDIYYEEKQFIEQEEGQVELDPLMVHRNLSSLFEITYNIQEQSERSVEEQRKTHYFEYLSSYFKQSINLFSQSFALTAAKTDIIEVISQVFAELFQQLKFIIKIHKPLAASCSRHLHEAVQIVNRCSYTKNEIPVLYVNKILTQDLQNGDHLYSKEQLNETFNLLDSFNLSQDIEMMQSVYLIKGRIQKALSYIANKEKNYNYSAEQCLLAFQNMLKYRTCLQTNLKAYKKQEIIERQQNSNQIIEEIVRNLCYSLHFLHKTASTDLLLTEGLLHIIQSLQSQLEMYLEKNQHYKVWEFYSELYERLEMFSSAKKFYKYLESNQEIKKQKRTLKIKQKIKNCEAKQKIKKQTKIEYTFDIDKMIEIVNRISQKILNQPKKYSIAQFRNSLSKIFNEKRQKKLQNEFDYQISKEPNYYEFITISQKLIKKIKQRKVILILGSKRSGKTTSFYWLLEKELTSTSANSRNRFQIDTKDRRSRINHKQFTLSFVPNIEAFGQQEELLIDFCSIRHERMMLAIIQLSILKLIIENSKEIKFLIVVNEDSLLKEGKSQVITAFQYIRNIFPENYNFQQHISLLINFSSQRGLTFEDFVKQFSKNYKNQTLFEQKYLIDIQKQAYYSEYLSNLRNTQKVMYLARAAGKDIEKSDFLRFNKQKAQHWRYVETNKLRKQAIFEPLSQSHQLKRQIESIFSLIMQENKKALKCINHLQIILVNTIKQQEIVQPFKLFSLPQQIANQFQYFPILNSHTNPQLFILNQICAFIQFDKYFREYFNSIQFFKNIDAALLVLTRIMKKMSFNDSDVLKCIIHFQKSFTEISTVFDKINEVLASNKVVFQSINSQIANLRFLYSVNVSKWCQGDKGLLESGIENLIQQLNTDLLIKQLGKSEEKYKQIMMEFLQAQFENEKNKAVIHEGTLKFKQLSLNQANYLNALKCQILLLRASYRQHQKLIQQQNALSQQLLTSKLNFIYLLKSSVAACTYLDHQFAFSVCDKLQCDDTKCKIFDILVEINQEKTQLLGEYMELCLSIGRRQTLKRLYENYMKVIQKTADLKQRYCRINLQISNNQIINKQRNIQFNCRNLTIQQLKWPIQLICEKFNLMSVFQTFSIQKNAKQIFSIIQNSNDKEEDTFLRIINEEICKSEQKSEQKQMNIETQPSVQKKQVESPNISIITNIQAEPSKQGIQTLQTVEIADDLKQKARKLRDQYKYGEALILYQRSLSIIEKINGKDNHQIANLQHELGLVYYYEINYAKALEYYGLALGIYERVKGKGCFESAKTLNNMGMAYDDQLNYAKALECYGLALGIYERVKGKGCFESADTLHNMGMAYDDQLNYAKALECYGLALGIYERVKGKGCFESANTLNNMGIVYDNQRDYAKALEYYSLALGIYERVKGKGCFESANTLNNMGIVYKNQLNYAKALECYKEAQSIYEKFGIKNREYGVTLFNMGIAYSELKDFEAAADAYGSSLKVYERLNLQDKVETGALELAKCLKILKRHQELQLITSEYGLENKI